MDCNFQRVVNAIVQLVNCSTGRQKKRPKRKPSAKVSRSLFKDEVWALVPVMGGLKTLGDGR
jgi:hypothetical protein